MISSMEDILDLHRSNGNIENAYIRIHMDNKVMLLNKYTMRIKRGNLPRVEARAWNTDIYRCVKKNRDLTKEVKEFISLFEFLNKAGIRSGYVEKSETPDFVLTRNGEKYGIEITKIYIGNDWVANKLTEEIKEFKLRKTELEGYMEYKKYKDKVLTYRVRGGLAIMPNTDNISVDDYIVELKNKIFTKVRKLADDYSRFEKNIIFVEVVSSDYFRDKFDVKNMCDELNYFCTRMECNFENTVAKVIIKLGDEFIEYNLSDRNYEII